MPKTKLQSGYAEGLCYSRANRAIRNAMIDSVGLDTIRALAEKTGIPEQTLYKRMSGTSIWKLDEFFKVVTALGMSEENIYNIFRKEK